MKPHYREHPFNGGRSVIALQFLPVNQAWLVCRRDGEHQGCVRLHASRADAIADYERRVEFARAVERASSERAA